MTDPVWKQTLEALEAGTLHLSIVCPDGTQRRIWYVNQRTGDVCIVGWEGEAWMDCSHGDFRVEFPKPTSAKEEE